MKKLIIALILAIIFIISLLLFPSNLSAQGGYAYGATLNATEVIPWKDTYEVKLFVYNSEFWKREHISNVYDCANYDGKDYFGFAFDFIEYARQRGRDVGLHSFERAGELHMKCFVVIGNEGYSLDPQLKFGGLTRIGKLDR